MVTVRMLLWAGVSGILLVVLPGTSCAPPPDDRRDVPPTDLNTANIFTLSPDNASVVTGAISTAESMVAANSDSASIAAALVAQLSADSRVAEASIDPASGFVVAQFHDGETQTFQTIGPDDLAEGSIDPVDNLPDGTVDVTAQPSSTARIARVAPAQLDVGFPTDMPAYAIPRLNNALMASAMPYFHPNWPSCNETERIQKMLESRGYSVTRERLQLKHFRELHKYGVLLLETHGVRKGSSNWMDITTCMNSATSTTVPNCGGSESLFGLLTTTTTADEPAANYREDISTGRLILHNVTQALVINDVPVQTVTMQYYAVTSLFLRQHVTEPYPDGMLFMMNACKAFTDGSNPIGSFILSKSRSSQFLGWNEKLKYQYAAKAALNLFQLMTASNEEVEIDGIPQLKKYTPPIGVAVDLNNALAALGEIGLDTAPTGAVLERRAAATDSGDLTEAPNLLLMPYAMGWHGPNSTASQVRLSMQAADGTTVTISDDSVSASPEMLCCSMSWLLSDKPSLYGNIVPWYYSRKGASRPLRRWRPVITVKKRLPCGDRCNGQISMEVCFQPQGRASIEWACARPSAWSKAPVPRFPNVVWERSTSSIRWKVTGEVQEKDERPLREEYYHRTYEGTGTGSFGVNDGGWMQTTDGTTVMVSVSGRITYTENWTRFPDGSTGQTQHEVDITTDFEAPLRANWSVAGGAKTAPPPDEMTTTWQEFFADPSFDNSEPR